MVSNRRALFQAIERHSGTVSSSSLNVQYGYEDSSGSTNTVRRKQVTYPNARQINFVYTSGIDGSLSRVSQIKDGSTDVQADYAYLGLGTVAIMNLVPPQLRYTLAGSARYDKIDNFDRLTGLTWFFYGSPTGFPERLDYTYDRLGNRLTRQRIGATGNDEKYVYDGLYRLRSLDRGTLSGGSITSPTFKQSWNQDGGGDPPGLDATGNWTRFREANTGGSWTLNQVRAHDKANTLTGFTTSPGTAWPTPAHDRAGNMTSVPRPKDLGNSYACTYDAWNRLVKVAGGSTTVSYGYDGLHRRITRDGPEASGATTSRRYYHSDAWQVLEERIQTFSGFAVDRQFIWGLRYVDDLIRRDRTTTGTLDEKLFVMQDGNFNVTAITDDAGAVKERYRYDAYGVPTFLDASFNVKTGGSDYEWETLYAGYRWDSTTGLYHVRYRAYHPSLGRWLQRDPIGYTGRVASLYQYCDSRPSVFLDPMGLIGYAEVKWCARNPACCCAAAHSNSAVKDEMQKRYGQWRDNTVENAVQHCAWICYVASLTSCSVKDALELGRAHEDYSGNPVRARAMDLHNNSTGANLSANGKSLTDCFDACEAEAKAHRLFWQTPVAGRAPGRGLPSDFPGFDVSGEGIPGPGVGTASPNPPGQTVWGAPSSSSVSGSRGSSSGSSSSGSGSSNSSGSTTSASNSESEQLAIWWIWGSGCR